MNPLPLLASDNTSSADHIMTINDVMVFTKALKLRSLLFGSHFISHPGNIFVWTANTSGIISFVLAVFWLRCHYHFVSPGILQNMSKICYIFAAVETADRLNTSFIN